MKTFQKGDRLWVADGTAVEYVEYIAPDPYSASAHQVTVVKPRRGNKYNNMTVANGYIFPDLAAALLFCAQENGVEKELLDLLTD